MDIETLPDRRGTGAFKWDLARPDEIPLWVADMDFPCASQITAALSQRIQHPVFGYTDVGDEYREAFCRWQQGRNNWTISPDELVIMPGVMPAISLVVERYTRPGDSVAIFSPVYFPFFEVTEQLGRHVVRIPLAIEQEAGPRYTIDEVALERALGESRMLLLCSPHNPGGRVWTRDELGMIAAAAQRHRVIVVSDEIHSDLLFPGETFVPWLTLAQARDIALLAPSKTFNIPGLPTAVAVIPDEDLRRDVKRTLHARKQDMSNLLAITAAHAAYVHGAAWLDEITAALHRNYRLVVSELAGESGVAVYRMEGTFIAWIDFRERWGAEAGVSRRFDGVARDHGVWLSRGRLFGPEGEGHMRLNFATAPDRLRAGVRRLRDALAAFDRMPGGITDEHDE